jgi:hypothetical protein
MQAHTPHSVPDDESTGETPTDQQPPKAVDWWADCFPQWKRKENRPEAEQ